MLTVTRGNASSFFNALLSFSMGRSWARMWNIKGWFFRIFERCRTYRFFLPLRKSGNITYWFFSSRVRGRVRVAFCLYILHLHLPATFAVKHQRHILVVNVLSWSLTFKFGISSLHFQVHHVFYFWTTKLRIFLIWDLRVFGTLYKTKWKSDNVFVNYKPWFSYYSFYLSTFSALNSISTQFSSALLLKRLLLWCKILSSIIIYAMHLMALEERTIICSVLAELAKGMKLWKLWAGGAMERKSFYWHARKVWLLGKFMHPKYCFERIYVHGRL